MSAPSLRSARETELPSALRKRHADANAKYAALRAPPPPLTIAVDDVRRLEREGEARTLQQLEAHETAEEDRAARLQRAAFSMQLGSSQIDTTGTKKPPPRRKSIWRAEIAATVTQEVNKEKSRQRFSMVARTVNMFLHGGKQNPKHPSVKSETMPPTEEEAGGAYTGHYSSEAQENAADGGEQDSIEHADKRDGPNHGPSGDALASTLPQMSAERPVASRSAAPSASRSQAPRGNLDLRSEALGHGAAAPVSRPVLPDDVPVITHDGSQVYTGEVAVPSSLHGAAPISRLPSSSVSAAVPGPPSAGQQVQSRGSAPSSLRSAPAPAVGRTLAPDCDGDCAGSPRKQRPAMRSVELQTHLSLMGDASPHAVSSSAARNSNVSLPLHADGSFAGTVHVRVLRILNFKDTAGWMDRTDPFVELRLGKTTRKTSVKSNAGGAAVFDEVFSFRKDLAHAELQVAVYDSDTLSNDLLGRASIDLTRQSWSETVDELGGLVDGKSFDVFDAKTGKVVQGQVVLAFAASVLIVKVHRIAGFPDKSGWMDRTDPFVTLKYGTQKFKTTVKDNAGGNAEYNEVFFFDLVRADEGLEVTVLDSDTMSDDELGRQHVQIRDLGYASTLSESQPMDIPVSKNGKEQGRVLISVARFPPKNSVGHGLAGVDMTAPKLHMPASGRGIWMDSGQAANVEPPEPQLTPAEYFAWTLVDQAPPSWLAKTPWGGGGNSGHLTPSSMVSTPQYGYSEAPLPGEDRGALYPHPGALPNPWGGGPYVSPPFYAGRSSASPDRWDAAMDHSYVGAPMRIRIL